MESNSVTRLPHWDMSVVYPSLESPEFEAGLDAVVEGVKALEGLFDEYKIERQDALQVGETVVHAYDTVTTNLNALLDQTQTLYAYISAFVTTNSRDTLAQAKLSAVQQNLVTLSKLDARYTAWIGSLNDLSELRARSQVARDHAYMLARARSASEHLMSPAEEDLAADMNLTGGSAWARLHGNVSSQIMVKLELDGETKTLPMSAVRNLAFDPRREVREKAYEAELAAWQGHAVPLAAAMNSIKGQVNTLAKRRHWASALDEAIFDAAIDRTALDAMLSAARESFPDFRRYLRAKARGLGAEQLPWYDLFAPVGQSKRVWEYTQAREFILTQFGTYSERLRGLAARAFDEQWIDAEPREGKRDGAFCMSLRGVESRVLSNYKPAYGGMSTLAHELGHAYHNLVKAHCTALQRVTPMTLAETASIFCETLARQAALREADAPEQLVILEASLQNSCQIVVDITSRFLFESRVFEQRAPRELSVDEFCTLMLDAQKETYGDGLDPEKLHPYMWAVKPHYYSADRSFYNFPYMFGLLFGLGLFAQYRENPAEFKKGYDDLLSSTGLADAATLAARFGIDVRTPEFWRASLDIVRKDIERFESLVQ